MKRRPVPILASSNIFNVFKSWEMDVVKVSINQIMGCEMFVFPNDNIRLSLLIVDQFRNGWCGAGRACLARVGGAVAHSVVSIGRLINLVSFIGCYSGRWCRCWYLWKKCCWCEARCCTSTRQRPFFSSCCAIFFPTRAKVSSLSPSLIRLLFIVFLSAGRRD